MCGGGVVSMHKIEDNSLDLILTFPHVDSGDQIQIIRPGYKHFFFLTRQAFYLALIE